MEAIILAGGKAERLGDAARGNPKALVPVAGHPLAEYQVAQLVRVGVDRVIVSCAAGQDAVFRAKLSGLGATVVTVAESEPLGRGGGLRLAARSRAETGPLIAMNGDELLDVDFEGLLGAHEAEAFQLEIRRLTRRYGRKIKELQIERARASRPARSP